MENLEDIISKYYPFGVSYFSGRYEETKEYKLLMTVLSKRDVRWDNFIDSCVSEFGLQAVDDRSEGEPGHVLLLHIKTSGQPYVIIWYVARILNAFCFRIQEIGEKDIFPNFYDTASKKWNSPTIQARHFIDQLTALMNLHFPGYILFEKDLNQIVPSFSTYVHDIGKATILNIFFTNYSY